MDLAVEDEKAQIARLPFTEEELQKALEILEKKTTGATAPKASASRDSNGH
jgi:hypothetical protein